MTNMCIFVFVCRSFKSWLLLKSLWVLPWHICLVTMVIPGQSIIINENINNNTAFWDEITNLWIYFLHTSKDKADRHHILCKSPISFLIGKQWQANKGDRSSILNNAGASSFLHPHPHVEDLNMYLCTTIPLFFLCEV